MIDIKERVHYYYWEKDINCAKTMLACLSEIFGVEIQEQVINGAIGLSGAGQFRAQCGLVEGGLMFLGIYFTKQGKTEMEIRGYCHDYAEQFQNKFGNLTCRALRPTGFSKSNPPHLCEKITCEAVEFAYEFVKKLSGIKICIIHGYTSHCNGEWFPWLGKKLQQQCNTVVIPEMPDSDNPHFEAWQKKLEEVMPALDEKTIFIGHSLGCVTALQYIARCNKKIKGAILVSGFIGKNPMKAQSKNLSAFTDAALDIDKMKALIPERYVITAKDDDIVPSAATVELANKLDCNLIVLQEGKHFIARDGYTELPVVYDVVMRMAEICS